MEDRLTESERRSGSTGLAHAPHKPVESRSRVGRAVRRARERSVVRGYRTATAAIGKISPRISMSVGKALFVTGYFAWPKKRRIILLNASHVLGLPASDYRVRHLARLTPHDSEGPIALAITAIEAIIALAAVEQIVASSAE